MALSDVPAGLMTRRGVIKLSALAAATMATRPLFAIASSPTNEIVSLSAIELSAAIRERSLSCVEVMRAYIAQAGALNPRFNALVSHADPERLLEQANSADKELAADRYRGWMHGFPHAVKDLADVEGFITTAGSPLYSKRVAKADAIIVERLKRAGVIVTAKTNVPEFGLGSQTYNTVFGPTLNPWDGKSTPGGSSGGAAAALALEMVPVADGSDLMGSLRNPAGFCNVIGFRPTPGRVPSQQKFTEELACYGPMGRNVSDVAMLLSTLAGYDARVPNSIPESPSIFASSLARDWNGARIGWLGDFDGYLPMEQGVLALCEKALDGFRAIGAEVEPATLDFSMEELWRTWLTFRHWLVRGAGAADYADIERRRQLKPEMIWEVEGGLSLTGQDVYEASTARGRFYAAVRTAFERYDFLVLPTAQVFPFDANTPWPKTIEGRSMDTYHRWMEVVIPGTLSGCPVAAVPAGFGEQGLPMGLQIIGPRYKDFATLQIAYAYEQATRWNLDYHPAALKR